jgi:hypothetical protein
MGRRYWSGFAAFVVVAGSAGLGFGGCATTTPDDQSGTVSGPIAAKEGDFRGRGDFGISVMVEPEHRPSTCEELVQFATLYAKQHGWKGVRAGKFVFDRWTPKEREILVVPLTVEALQGSGVKVGDAEWLFVFAEK